MVLVLKTFLSITVRVTKPKELEEMTARSYTVLMIVQRMEFVGLMDCVSATKTSTV